MSVEQPQSLTCPYCTKMGFTEATLQEHVAADHPDTSFEVVRVLKDSHILFIGQHFFNFFFFYVYLIFFLNISLKEL